MNELVIPPSPNWYNDLVLVCTPEKHIIYASRKDIVIIHPAPPTEAAEVRIIHGAHDERVLSLNANLVSWGKLNRQLVSVGEDKIVKIWDFDTLTSEMQHNDHEKNSSPIVSASFAGERVISVAENGYIVVWQLTANTRRVFNNIFGLKVKVMCMATCPHAGYLSAFGLASGLVIVADLRQYGKVLYKLREHDHDITGLSWCPTPYNIYKTKSGRQMLEPMRRKPSNNSAIENSKEGGQKQATENSKIVLVQRENLESKLNDNLEENQQNVGETSEASEIPNDVFMQMSKELQENLQKEKVELPESQSQTEDSRKTPTDLIKKDVSSNKPVVTDDEFLEEIVYPKRERPTIVDKKNPWGNVIFNDSDEEAEDKEKEKPEFNDFLLECQRIKAKIESAKEKNEQENAELHVVEKNVGQENSEMVSEILEDVDNKVTNENESLAEDVERLEIQKVETNEELRTDVKEKETITKERNIIMEDFVLDLTLLNPEEKREYLLASACRAGKICIWRAGTDGHLQIQLPKHMKSSYTNKKRDHRQNWISLCWAQPTLILSSSIWHELLQWDILPNPKNNKFQIKSSLVHADHHKYIFTIAIPYQIFDKPENENWRSDKELCVWTTSQDRWLLRTNLSTKCNVSSYFTFGGNVNCISVSQLDPNRLAYACGDGSIHIWDLSRPHTQHITSVAFFDKVHTKASCIDWHPTRENFLAFSTCDGRIGEYDLTNRSKNATIYSQYHRGDIYKLQWGPLPGDEEKYGLYSCSMGELIVHDSSKPNKEPIQLVIFEDERDIVNFSWKSDYSVLAVGSKTGAVRLLNNKFQLLQTLYMQKKSVRGLEWHPLATACDSGLSEFSNTLAVSTKETEIYIYDCLNTHGDADTKIGHKILKGHKSSVKSISWCPHVSGRLVSSDENTISIVWDIKTQNMISVFVANADITPIVVWSPLDADLIISGSKILQIWRITKNPPVLPTILPKKQDKNKRHNLVKITPMIDENQHEEIITQKRGKQSILTLTLSALNKQATTINSCKKLLLDRETEKVDFEKKKESDSEEEEFEDAKEHTDLVTNGEVEPLKLFQSRKDMMSLLDQEQTHHLNKKKVNKHGFISLCKGNLSDTIKHAIDLNEISPWLIGMAPMVSHKVWQELCEKYAQILCDKEEYFEASSYYLACHKIDEAIDALCKGNHYTEALILSKVRLPEGNEQTSLILDKWLKYCVVNGIFEIAALLYIKTGKYLEAAEILNKRSDLETLKLAAKLAEDVENKDLLSTINIKISELEKTTTIPSNGISICESRLQALILTEQKNELSHDENDKTIEKSLIVSNDEFNTNE